VAQVSLVEDDEIIKLRVQIVKVENEGRYGGNIGGAGRMRKGHAKKAPSVRDAGRGRFGRIG
jgi:hypothetical protein